MRTAIPLVLVLALTSSGCLTYSAYKSANDEKVEAPYFVLGAVAAVGFGALFAAIPPEEGDVVQQDDSYAVRLGTYTALNVGADTMFAGLLWFVSKVDD